MRATEPALGELVDADGSLDDGVVDDRGVSVVLVDELLGVVVLNLLRRSLYDRLNLFDDVLGAQ